MKIPRFLTKVRHKYSWKALYMTIKYQFERLSRNLILSKQVSSESKVSGIMYVFFYDSVRLSSFRIICWHKSSVDIEQNCHFYLQSFFTKKNFDAIFAKRFNFPWNHSTFEFLLHRHQNWVVLNFSLNTAYFSNKNLHRKKNLSKVGNTDW